RYVPILQCLFCSCFPPRSHQRQLGLSAHHAFQCILPTLSCHHPRFPHPRRRSRRSPRAPNRRYARPCSPPAPIRHRLHRSVGRSLDCTRCASTICVDSAESGTNTSCIECPPTPDCDCGL
ncbi:hypothetical protein C8F01DRAFT_1366593, partial [Mycena amicta]